MSDSDLRLQALQACHGLAASGLGNIIGGHVSIRVPGRELFWTNPFDIVFEEVTEEDLLLLDFNGRVLEGNRPNRPAFEFHPAIYGLRPDVGAIVHTHGYWNMAQAAFGRPPRMLNNLCVYFHNKVAIPADDTFEQISAAIGDNNALVMPFHGAITVGSTIGQAAALHSLFELAARLDVTLPADAPVLPDDECFRVQRALQSAADLQTVDYLELTWQLMRRRALAPGARPLAAGGLPETLPPAPRIGATLGA